jgi:hypothetical protein
MLILWGQEFILPRQAYLSNAPLALLRNPEKLRGSFWLIKHYKILPKISFSEISEIIVDNPAFILVYL